MAHLLVALMLSLCAVQAYGGFQSRLDDLELLAHDDVLFDVDPGRALRIMVHGQGWEGRSLQHPLWGAATSLPLAAIERASRPLRPSPDPEGFRRRAALASVRLAGAVAVVLSLFTLVTLGVPLRDASLAAAVHAAAFSSVVFGSVPEHWMLSSAILSAALLATARLAAAGQAPSRRLLAAVSFVAGAITITNAVLVLLPLAASARQAVGWRRAAVSGAVAFGAACTMLAVGYGVQVAVMPGAPDDLQRSPAWVLAHVERHPLARAAAFPFEVANAVAPASIAITPAAVTAPGLSANRAVGLPAAGWASLSASSVLMLPLLIAGGVAAVRLGGAWHAVAVGIVLVLAFNWALHSMWGGAQLFAYSAHWMPVVPLLLGALSVALNAWRPGAGTWLLAVVAGAVAANSWRLARMLLDGMAW
jgi:hypothetical protein